MRVLNMLVALAASVAASYGAYNLIRAVGPADRTGEYGFGEGATVSPNGGDLFESRNFALVVAALERELGADAVLQSLTVNRTDAGAVAHVGGRRRYVDVDASGRSRARDGDPVEPAAVLSLGLVDAAAIDRIVAAAEKEAGAPVESLSLFGNRQWSVRMERGEPDSFVANLDGGALRLPGEPNPEPIGAAPDSLLRAANLGRVLAAAREAAPGGRVRSLDVRPDRVGFAIEQDGRELRLDYGYDAQLTSRDIRPLTGVDTPGVPFDRLDARMVERMARRAGKELDEVRYVLLSHGSDELSMHFAEGSDPPYVTAEL